MNPAPWGLALVLSAGCASPGPISRPMSAQPPDPAPAAPSAPAAPTSSAAPTVGVAEVSVPAPTSPPPAPSPPQAPIKATAKIELRMPPSVVLGESIRIELSNVDDHDHAFWIPAAPNGCGAFHFEVTFTGAGKTYREDRSNIGCSQALVPGRWFVIQKGASSKFDQPTDMPVLAGGAKPPPLGVAGKTLAPGKYELKLTGADISVRGTLTLVAP